MILRVSTMINAQKKKNVDNKFWSSDDINECNCYFVSTKVFTVQIRVDSKNSEYFNQLFGPLKSVRQSSQDQEFPFVSLCH